ncbi:Xaa-Pro aminopeptidase [Silvimonas terrae]|uniref:Xaa-Pro aminopeptidase n=1 Tax=Silvimonas terrae TaxID=300266 RepID=A0A840RLB2_9NEIS|nr:Xaa-Pro aminopeptidase [Silvimonas terrae]MBB5192992.1 Xaa-Pro aminopeptidase [Silvimonas terrae]
MQPAFLQPFSSRRQRLFEQLAPGVLILPTAPEQTRNADSTFPFRYDSSFYYLSGFQEPEAVIALVIGEKESKAVLFCRPKDETHEIWDGFRYGPEAAKAEFGFDEAYTIDELDTEIVNLLKNQPRVYFALGADAGWDARLTGWINGVRKQSRTGITAPGEVIDAAAIVDEMRLFKDAFEIDAMHRAGKINSVAHIRAMQAAKAGIREYVVEAELQHEYYRSGSRFPAYTSIVASGPNACVLHYDKNDRLMQEGDLLLIDAGCEIEGYASDITRTFPINGRFTPEQKTIYELVLAAHAAALDQARPGNRYSAMHDAAVKTLTAGLIELGFLSGTVDEAIENKTFRQFYMHGTGHWLGLDVHDAGRYKIDGEDRVLEVGMAFTIEPGLYIRPAGNVPKAYEYIGVRIEDDIVLTENGPLILSDDCPRTVAEIEAVMNRAA